MSFLPLPFGLSSRSGPSTKRPIRKSFKSRLVCEQLEKRILLASNILVDPNNGLPSSSLLLEYTPAGSLVSSNAIPYPFAAYPEIARGLAVDAQGDIQVFDGGAHPYLTSFTPTELESNQFPGLNQTTSPAYGSIGTYGNYVFAPSNSTQFGIVRFDTNNYSSGQGFVSGVPYGILTVGLDGLLYAVNATSADVYDPLSLAKVGSVPLSVAVNYTGIAVDATGDIFASDAAGNIYEFGKTGTLLKTLDTETGPGFASLALANDGTLIGASSANTVIVTNESLSSFTTFTVTNNNTPFFAAFADPQTENLGLPISAASSPIDAGGATTFTVTALSPSFVGAVHFTSSDSQATLPADYTFTLADHGVHTFSATLRTAGMQTIAVRSLADGTVSGDVLVQVQPLAATTFGISEFGLDFGLNGDTTHLPQGVEEPFVVTAEDQFGNTDPNYSGTVHFTSSDALALLPADYTFSSGDRGTHGFNVTFNSWGTQTLAITDALQSSVTGVDSDIPVTFNIPTVTGVLVVANNAVALFELQGFQLGEPRAVPSPTSAGYSPGVEFVRAVTVDYHQQIDVFNGTFEPFVDTYISSAGGNEWVPRTNPDWSIDNTTYNGSIADYGPYLFVPDESTPGQTTNGIVRFNITNHTSSLFVTGTDYNKLTVGFDGLLYALRDGGGVNHVDVYDPSSGALLRTITLSVEDVYTGIGVTATGDIYMAAQSSYIYHFTSQGALIDQISTNCTLSDMALAADGTIVAEGDGRICVTDETLRKVSFFPNIAGQFGINFIGFANYQSNVNVFKVPEPRSVMAGTPTNVTITALDAPFVNETVTFTSSDPNAIFPAEYTFTAADQGAHTFNVTFFIPGEQTLSVRFLDNSSGQSVDDITPIAFLVTPDQVAGFAVAGYPDSVAGQSQTFTVTAIDSNGVRVFSYLGTVALGSSDGLASLPDAYTFTASDEGTHEFSATLDTAGVQSLTATDTTTANVTGTQLNINISPAAASRLAFQAQPSNVVAGTAISPAVTVQVFDAFGNLVTDDDNPQVMMSVASGPGKFTAASITTTTPSAGVATFDTLVLDTAGVYTLKAALAGGGSAVSTSFTVSHAAPSQVSFTKEPGSGTAGVALSPTVQISELDQFGNLIQDDNVDQVRLSIATGPGIFDSSSTNTVALSGGVATFGNLVFDKAGSYVLAENATGGLTGPNSISFVIHAGAVSLSQSTVAVAPASIQSGSVGIVTLTARDAEGNPESGGGLTISFALGAGTSAGTFGTVVDKLNGTYTANLTGTIVGTPRAVTATIGGQPVTSIPPTFVVTPGPAAKIVVITIPGNPIVADAPFNVTFSVFDAQGNLATNFVGAVALNSSDAMALLPGNYSFTAADQGVHTFAVTVEDSGVQTLTATDTSNSAVTVTANMLVVVVSKIVPINPVSVIYAPDPIASQNEAFIKGLYRLILGRNADPGGLAFWSNYMDVHGTSLQVREQIVNQGFWNSTENRTREVNGYYETYLGRPAEAQGLDFWINQLQNGEDETAVVGYFLLQQEAAKLDNSDWVTNIYEGALGRKPDTSGVAYWTNILNTSQLTRTQVEQEFVFGAEAAGAAVDSFYIDYLQRVSDAPGRAFFVQEITSGSTTYASVAQMLLASDEFFTNAANSVTG